MKKITVGALVLRTIADGLILDNCTADPDSVLCIHVHFCSDVSALG